MRRTMFRWLLLAVALGSTACGAPSLRHVGYVGDDKVFYHWAISQDEHTIVVCDIQPDGSETNCRESGI